MNIYFNFTSRKSKPIGLLLLTFLLIIVSCNSKTQNDSKHKEPNESIEKIIDSLKISVKFYKKGKTGFNLTDHYFFSYYEDFRNPVDTTNLISKTIAKIHDQQIFHYGNIIQKDGKFKVLISGILVSELSNQIGIDFVNNSAKFLGNYKGVWDLTSLYESYSEVMIDGINEKEESRKKRLNAVFNSFQKEFTNNQYLQEVNELFFYSRLAEISSENEKVHQYLISLKKPIASIDLSSLLYFYVKHRIENIDLSTINLSNYSKEYIDYFSKGVFAFLRHEDQKGDNKYQDLINWFYSTDLYKNDSIYIKKEIIPIDNKVFKRKLKKLIFENTGSKRFTLNQIIESNPSDYYLIDFWATWCAPCIEGVKLMEKMNLPKNVKVLSISVDRIKDKKKWVQMTERLKQPFTFWLDDKNPDTIDFMRFVEIESLPRYMLIDQNMNLLDQAFFHPSESQFLPKLYDIKNHSYW